VEGRVNDRNERPEVAVVLFGGPPEIQDPDRHPPAATNFTRSDIQSVLAHGIV